MSKLTKREKIMILVLLVIAVGIAYYLLAYQPLTGELSDKENVLESKEMELDQTIALIEQIPQLERKYEELKFIEDSEEKYKDITAENYIKVLEDLSQKMGVNLTSYQPNRSENGIEFNIVIEGYYNSVNNFLREIKEMETRFSYNSLSMTPSREERMRLNISLFYNFEDNIGDDGGDRT